ncbi:MAG: dihydroorotase [Betaproteobacteria bacterium]
MTSSSPAASRPARIVVRQPDDWHVHLRDGPGMWNAATATARAFARALVMPNLRPPVTTTAAAQAYRDRIMAALPASTAFLPLMTLYFTDETSPAQIREAKASGIVLAVKYYPAGATTNSASGVTDIAHVYPALAAMEAHGVVLSVHGEVTAADVDIFDRERVFVDTVLARLVRDFPALKVVLEHITTEDAAAFVLAAGPNVAATITPQHLLYARNAMLVGGVRPHLYCLPILKRERHRQALLRAAISGNPKFFLGTDSAPHARQAKESECGCAGCFSGHAAVELYVEAFEAAGALDRFEAFGNAFGADFYGVPRNAGTITLARQEWVVPASYPFGDETVIPLRAGEAMPWKLVDASAPVDPAGRA